MRSQSTTIASFFFFNDTAPTEIYPLSLHDALPISKKPLPVIARELNADAVVEGSVQRSGNRVRVTAQLVRAADDRQDRKSTRLNSSHSQISYAVFCLKKKKSRWHHVVPACLLAPRF